MKINRKAAMSDELIRSKRKKMFKDVVHHTWLQAVLIVVAVLYLFVFLWMLATSLKPASEFDANALTLIVRRPQFGNYWRLITVMPFFRYVGNTLFVEVFVILGTLFSTSLVSFSFAKLRWPGRSLAFTLLLASMLLPAQVLQIPQFVMFKTFGWKNTYLPLIVPAFFATSAFNVFLAREFVRGISNELMDAAKIDGCSYWRIWWQIVFPLCMPINLSIVIMTFMGTWNDFMTPLIYIDDPQWSTLSLGLREFQSQYKTEWDLMMSGAVLSMLPTLVIFFIFQKYFLQSMDLSSGIKG